MLLGETKNLKVIVIGIISVTILAFLIFLGGRFLFSSKNELKQKKPQEITNKKETPIPYKKALDNVVYKQVLENLFGNPQAINILELDLSHKNVILKPVLSFKSMFGYEKLSVMAEREKAYAAVTSGFYHSYGEPSGLILINGELITASTGKYPVYIYDGKKAVLKQMESKLGIKVNDKKIPVNALNTTQNKTGITVYTNYFGTTNRIKTEHYSISIVNGIAGDLFKKNGEVEIPDNGILISASTKKEIEKISVKKGDKVEFFYEPELGSSAQAYECGCWLLKDGNVIVGDFELWIGTLNNLDPRTAIGIKEDGRVVLVTVDGRQPGHSAGFTGRQLGEYLKTLGIKDAAMLDGGSSTEMIIKGQILNKPSNKGLERPLAGGFVVQLLGD